MRNVITFRLAYLDQHVTLCAECEDAYDRDVASLGPVSHGQHRGHCDHCEPTDEAPAYEVQDE